MLASEKERDVVLKRLRAGYAGGLIGEDTLERRVDATLHATRRGELASLIVDLPDRLTVLRDAWTQLTRRHSNNAATDVQLPGWTDPGVVLGRSRSCDVTLTADDAVSSRHAEVRALLDRDRWLIIDLGSLNGTWFLGRRVSRTVVQAGDQLLLGRTVITLIPPH